MIRSIDDRRGYSRVRIGLALVATLTFTAVCWAEDPAPNAPAPNPPAEQPTAEQPAATQPAASDHPTPEEMDRIKELIAQAVKAETEEERKAALAELRDLAKKRSAERGIDLSRPPALPQPAVGRGPISATQLQRGQAATTSTSGCGPGESGLDFTPPPAGQPQPKFVCAEPLHTLEPLWAGGTAVFAYQIRNEGEAQLNIRLTGG